MRILKIRTFGLMDVKLYRHTEEKSVKFLSNHATLFPDEARRNPLTSRCSITNTIKFRWRAFKFTDAIATISHFNVKTYKNRPHTFSFNPKSLTFGMQMFDSVFK